MLQRALTVGGGGGDIGKSGYSASYPTNGKITCGFKPKYILMSYLFGSSRQMAIVYDETVSTTQTHRFYDGVDQGMAVMDNTGNNIASIDNDGFTLSSYSTAQSATKIYWAAIG